jgi:hypothetical protein
VTIPPGARAKGHEHEGHETTIYILSGESGVWYGQRLLRASTNWRCFTMTKANTGRPNHWKLERESFDLETTHLVEPLLILIQNSFFVRLFFWFQILRMICFSRFV